MFQALEEHLILFAVTSLSVRCIFKLKNPKPVKDIFIDKKTYDEFYNIVIWLFVIIGIVFTGYHALTWISNERGLSCFMSKTFLDTAPLFIEIMLSGVLNLTLFFLGRPIRSLQSERYRHNTNNHGPRNIKPKHRFK